MLRHLIITFQFEKRYSITMILKNYHIINKNLIYNIFIQFNILYYIYI